MRRLTAGAVNPETSPRPRALYRGRIEAGRIPTELAASPIARRAASRAEKNRAIYGPEGPHGYGHNDALEVAVEGEIDPETAMVVNLTDLDRILKEEVDAPLDHRNLNRDVPEFANLPPTAENLAAWIWRRVSARIPRDAWPWP